MPAPVICWFRQDLRLSDNPAWTAACKTKSRVIPVYILDDENAGPWKMGATSRVWLHHSLTALDKSLAGNLLLLKGRAEDILPKLAKDHGASKIFWNRCYEPWRIARDSRLKDTLTDQGIKCESFNGSLLWEPWDIKKQDGTPYRVFTPFFRKGCLSANPPRAPLPAPQNPVLFPTNKTTSEKLNLLPTKPRWDTPMLSHWTVGEAAAQIRLKEFIEHRLKGYKDGRNYPARNNISRLSPHLHFGEISPNQAWHASIESGIKNHAENDLDCFHSELAWREFSHSLLYYNPALPEEPLNKKFTSFDWNTPDPDLLEKWQKGQTGFPIVDAGMRELWQTGYMHNRVRMIVASFLVKDLR
ncbi:MAG TPA: deoxyribodipyrimidine photo-lyase, partial [Alphaproteobacteria bacterium]|nr:deoxyribodipyrimidine photo-lyase [Alphaproteobacteria bacterium]